MKNLYKYLAAILIISVSACTKQNIIDTGISNGIHKTSMMEYLKTDSYNWDSTVVLIKRANLEPLFSGTDPAYPQITFWGPTNHSIRRYMLMNQIKSIQDMSVADCRQIILEHVVAKRYLKNDFAFKNVNVAISAPNSGGTDLVCVGGNKIRAYKEQQDDPAAPNTGPIFLRLYSLDNEVNIPVASPDIQTNNGVVMSLGYSYGLGDI